MKKEDTVVALIYPNQEFESDVTKDIVMKSTNLVDLKIGVKRVKQINKGGVLIEVISMKDQKLELKVNTNENLKENFTISRGEKFTP